MIFSRIKSIAMMGASLLIALIIAIKSYRKGVQSGHKKALQSIDKAEAQRHAIQEALHNRHQQAIQEAMAVDSDRVVDHFNRMFHHPKESPTSDHPDASSSDSSKR